MVSMRNRSEQHASSGRLGRPARTEARTSWPWLLLAVAATCATVGCGKKDGASKTKAALEQCRSNSGELQKQLNDLKTKLAQALANPGSINVDPELLKIDGKLPTKSAGISVKEGSLKQQEVISVWNKSRGSLRSCYNRALKRNSALHHQSITLNVAFEVRASGNTQGISVRPSRDARMTDCMTKAIKRWRFPKFKGRAVGVSLPITFRPKG